MEINKDIQSDNVLILTVNQVQNALQVSLIEKADCTTTVRIKYIDNATVETIFEFQLDPASALMFADQIKSVLRYSSWAIQRHILT
jgi:hypothetical protein